MKTIETERLILRGWQLDDLDDFYEYAKNPNVGPMAGWEPHSSKEVSTNILKSFIEKDEVWAIALKENGKAIGSIGIHPEENKGKYKAKSIGFVLSKDYWNKGYMTEAVKRVMQYAFDELNLDMLTVFHFPHNLRSKSVIEKCGFEYETTLKQTQKIYDGQVFDSVCYSVLKSDYYKNNNLNITIKPLTPELAADYFDFFENRAFTDDSPYRCYCQPYQMSKEQAKTALEYANANGLDSGQSSRRCAEQQIESGALQGYLAFVDGVSIGWCNANNRANFPIEPCTDTNFYASAEKREKAVTCFEIAPNYRGKGVATALLTRVCEDAKADGYNAVVGFPVIRDERYEWDCTGPIRLYEKLGFAHSEDATPEKMIMIKELRR